MLHKANILQWLFKKWVDFNYFLLIYTVFSGSNFLYILQRSELLYGIPNSIINTDFAKSGVDQIGQEEWRQVQLLGSIFQFSCI